VRVEPTLNDSLATRRTILMSESPKPRSSLISLGIISVLAIAAIWLNIPRNRGYASFFHAPRLHDSGETSAMQKAFEEIVAQRNLTMPLEKQKEIARLFHELDVWRNMWYLGIPIQKNPCDLWMMQQIIYETKPEVIVETGTFRGGSALYFANALEATGLANSKVITVDVEDGCREAATLPLWQKHVEFILGSSTDPKVVEQIRRACRGKRVLVVLDSVHEKDHVLKELQLYAPLVSPDNYLVVEDSNSDGVPIFPGSVGPTAAIMAFLPTAEGRNFKQDVSREAMVLTFNPGGWLKRNSQAVTP
jgi:cephalosporin hydroxylase